MKNETENKSNPLATTTFIILGADGNRALSKYYRQENNPSSFKGLVNAKEKRALEKGLWEKIKQSRGLYAIALLLLV